MMIRPAAAAVLLLLGVLATAAAAADAIPDAAVKEEARSLRGLVNKIVSPLTDQLVIRKKPGIKDDPAYDPTRVPGYDPIDPEKYNPTRSPAPKDDPNGRNLRDLPEGRDRPEGAVPLAGGNSTTSITYTSLKDTSLKTSVYEGRVVTNEPKGKNDPKNPAKRIGDVTVTCTSTCNGGGTVSGCDANWSGCSSCSCSGFSGSCTCTKISVYTESK